MGPSIGSCLAPSFPHTELETPRSFLVQVPHSSDEETVPERGSDTPKVTLCVSDKTGVRSDLRPLPMPRAPEPLLGWAQTQNSSVRRTPDPSGGPWARGGGGGGGGGGTG